nr:PorP/SprF family type IX secretion system membrane protein [Pedobacter sp. SYSU D00873]
MRRGLPVKKFLLMLALTAISGIAQAQDYIYSQFYNAPIYLNPALTGQFKGAFRMNMIYRNQWSAMEGDLSYLTASADYQFKNINGGVGLMVNSSNEGTAYLKKNNIAGTYSYNVGGGRFMASFGLQAGITNSSVDFSKFVFSDQIDPRTGLGGSASLAEIPVTNSKYYFDAGAGVNLVMGNAMVGTSMLHLNKPNESFTGSSLPTPIRTAVHASYRYALDRYDPYDESGSFLIPSVIYYKQAQATSFSAGLQFKKRGVNAGLWYRSTGKGANESLVLSLIFDIFTNPFKNQKVRLGVSHDASTGKVSYGNTNGSSEMSVGFETGEPRESGFGDVKCYDFY